jgi:cyclophilin family peptidyl-prolyl cis-trans isomerase
MMVSMKKAVLIALCATALIASPLVANEEKVPFPSPPEIVAKAKAEEWVAIAPADLLIMDLKPVGKGKNAKQRRVIIQLIPEPFGQGWVGNIRKLAAAKWWDGTSINRVQDNYVVQWGDATEKKALPDGLAMMPESGYLTGYTDKLFDYAWTSGGRQKIPYRAWGEPAPVGAESPSWFSDPYSYDVSFYAGFPLGIQNSYIDNPDPEAILSVPETLWPVHCYGMVGVGRNLSPDTGSGAELYTVIGHAPRHLDRNIALVGRVIEGIEHLSSLPRGTGPLGFYEKEKERVPILSIRIGDIVSDLPTFQYLSTESASFAAYADARANRRDPFFNVPAGGADICNIPVPVRRKAQ